LIRVVAKERVCFFIIVAFIPSSSEILSSF
jgi:hypothetical protein